MEKEDKKITEVQSLEKNNSESLNKSRKCLQSHELEVKNFSTSTTKKHEQLLAENKSKSSKIDMTEKCSRKHENNNKNILFVNTEDTRNHIVTANQGICYTRWLIEI